MFGNNEKVVHFFSLLPFCFFSHLFFFLLSSSHSSIYASIYIYIYIYIYILEQNPEFDIKVIHFKTNFNVITSY